MRAKRIEKFTKPLPDRQTLHDLDKSGRTIQDYAKANENKETNMPAVLGFLTQRRRRAPE